MRGLAGLAVVLGYSTCAVAEVPVARFDFDISAPQRGAFAPNADGLRLPVTAVVVDGASAYLPEDFAPLLTTVVGRDSTMAEIAAVAEAIEAKYRADGFLLVRAAVPAQRPTGGVFHIVVTEETIGAVVIQGVEGATKARLEALLVPLLTERPVRAATVERALLLANDLPGLKVSSTVQSAGDDGLAADLVVTATETAFEATVTADNSSSRYAGPWLFSADVTANSPTGHGEQLALGATLSVDATQTRAFRGRWSQPLGTDGLQATTSIAVGRYEGGYTMRVYGEQEHTLHIAERVSWPILRSRERTIALEGGFAYNDIIVDMNGSNAYTDHWRVASLGLTWREGGWAGAGTTSLSLAVAQGLPILGASERGDLSLSRDGEGDPQFTKLTFEASGKWWLDSSWAVHMALAGQYAFSTTVEAEEFSLGGYRFGRGFDPSSLLGDCGIGETLELQYQFSTDLLADSPIQLFAFLDHGQIWDLPENYTSSLASTGIGIRTNVFGSLFLAVQLAHPLYGPDSTVANDPVRPYVSAVVRF